MTTTIPQTIPFSSVSLGERGRTAYNGIEQLADSIADNGLIQPIVLSPIVWEVTSSMENGVESEMIRFLLCAGGRRTKALELLLSEGKWDGTFHHGVTSAPGRPGFVLKDEVGSPLTNLLTEIAENRDRDDMDWRDEVKLIVRAAKLLRQDAHANGHMIVMRDLGTIIGCGYSDLQVAERIHDDLVANPQDYENVSGLRAAVGIALKKQEQFMSSILLEKTMSNRVQSELSPVAKDIGTVLDILDAAETMSVPQLINLSSRFHNCNGLKWLMEHEAAVDHIICDPDFGVSVERLEAGVGGASDGVAQKSVNESLGELESFIHLSFHALKEKGFCVFFFDMDHWEKLQRWGTEAGFAVQRWPVTWHKTDYRSNASPQTNTCKNVEWFMICRKPGTVLATSPQMSSVWAGPSESAAKEFGHPFAKPRWLWHKMFDAFCLKGQTVLDPFAGSGSSTLSAVEWGLNPIGCEVQEVHYNTLLLNLQKEYRKMLGDNVTFA